MNDLEAAIAQAHAAAREVWPGCTLALERFHGELVRRLGGAIDPAKLRAICTADVYLAIAALDGDPVAIQHLEREPLAEIALAARKLRATDDQADEVGGHIRRILFTAEPGRSAGLAEYRGQGNLRSYVRVIASRDLIAAINRGRKQEPIEPLLDKLDISQAPELALLRSRYGVAIAESLNAAIEALDERPRSLLRYAMVSGWTVDRIGKLYGVHGATASRWIAAAREALADRVREQVAQRLAVASEEVDSIVRLVQSQVDISLARVL
jgi:RNA polymerase sigma-70 factor (ECF subfamily)